MEGIMTKVLVTGATGFIGLHCIAQLLQQDYHVVGTVRTPSRKKEVVSAMTNAGVSAEKLSFVEADLTKDKGWDDAFAGCDYVLHVASPFIVGVPKHEDELIVPAVGGVERVLTAAIKAGVKKTVMTSSCAALDKTHDGKTHFTEEDWTDVDHPKTPAYHKSKTLAERRAWEIYKAQKGKNKMQLAVINPAAVVGPVLSDDIGTSNVFIKQIITGEVPGCPKMHLGFVDVRDVASLHLLAMQNEAADGHRFIASEREYWFKEVSGIMRDSGYTKAPSRELPNFLVKAMGMLNPELKQLANFVGKEMYTASEKPKKILGWQPRPANESLVETAQQLTDKGFAS
jgi:dihydroflavonol-4-reductase